MSGEPRKSSPKQILKLAAYLIFTDLRPIGTVLVDEPLGFFAGVGTEDPDMLSQIGSMRQQLKAEVSRCQKANVDLIHLQGVEEVIRCRINTILKRNRDLRRVREGEMRFAFLFVHVELPTKLGR